MATLNFKISNNDHNIIAVYATKTETYNAYPKRLRVYSSDVELIKDTLLRAYRGKVEKADSGGTGKNRFVRLFFTSKDMRDKVAGDIARIRQMGEIEEGGVTANGTPVQLDGTTLNVKSLAKSETATATNNVWLWVAIGLGVLLLIGGTIFFIKRKK